MTVFLRNLSFWPVIAITIVRSTIEELPSTPYFVTRSASDSRITEYKENLFQELSALKRLSPSLTFSQEIEEAVERYVELSAIVQTGPSLTAESSVFSITDHPNKKIAASCLNRRNLNRIAAHRRRAAQDIVRTFLDADISERSRNKFCDLLIGLAGLYEDEIAADHFREFRHRSLPDQMLAGSLR